MVKINLTELRLGEITHKMGIVMDEPDLQESYEIDQEKADEIFEFFRDAKPGMVEFPEEWLGLLIGELENAMSIHESNWLDCGDTDAGGYYRSLYRLVETLKEIDDIVNPYVKLSNEGDIDEN